GCFQPAIRNIHLRPGRQEPPVPTPPTLLQSLPFLDCSSSSNPSLTIGLLALLLLFTIVPVTSAPGGLLLNQLGLNSPGHSVSPTLSVNPEAFSDITCASTRCVSRSSSAILTIITDASW